MTTTVEKEWTNWDRGDDEFGLLRYQQTFIVYDERHDEYGPLNYTVRIRGVDYAGSVTPEQMESRPGETWGYKLEDWLRKQHDLPPADRRSPERKEIDRLGAENNRLRGLCETAIAATETEIIRTGFTLTPEHGLGAIYNAMLLALGRTPWGGKRQ